MDRPTLLAAINRHLRESLAETGELRPLGEIVGRVLDEIGEPGSAVSSEIIPVEKVAAVVDGTLNPGESDWICRIAISDRRVLSEIVAATRARNELAGTLPGLSDSLSAQLMSMSRTLATESEVNAADPMDRLQVQPPGRNGVASKVSPTREESQPEQPSPELPAIVATRERSAAGTPNRRQSAIGYRRIGIVLVATAAAIGLIVFLIQRDRPERPGDFELTRSGEDQNPVGGPDRMLPSEGDPRIDPAETPQEILQTPAESSSPKIVKDDATGMGGLPEEGVTPENGLPKLPLNGASPNDSSPSNPSSDSIAIDPKTPTPYPPITPMRPPIVDPPRETLVASISEMKWTRLTGLLTQQNPMPAGESSSQRSLTWGSIDEGSTTNLSLIDNDATQRRDRAPRTLQTLPLCRAEAQFGSGGRLVMDGDTAMRLVGGRSGASADLELQHGAVAMVELPEGTVLRLRTNNQVIASLSFVKKSTLVLQRAAGGIEVSVDEGDIRIDARQPPDKAFRIAMDQTIESMPEPKRLPRWVEQPIHSIPIKPVILAQIAASDDVLRGMNEQFAVLANSRNPDAASLELLARWQASMVGNNVLRLLGRPFPIVRAMALERILTMSPRDPRYASVWRMINAAIKDPARVARMKRMSLMAQNGQVPVTAQINGLLDDLRAPDVASRAMADYLLRYFFRNGPQPQPVFDPTATNQALQRMINVWRQYTGRNANRTARP